MSLSDSTILVVDDDPDICWALVHVIAGLGARCIQALDGQTAMQAARANRVTLALLDAKLPDTDGLELARSLRAADPEVRILLVSGYFYKDDPAVQTALKEGLIREFIEKPFSHAQVVQTVKNALSLQAGAPLAARRSKAG